jgi:hypothetical protein
MCIVNTEEYSLETTRHLYYQSFQIIKGDFDELPYHDILRRFRDIVGSYYIDYCDLLFDCEKNHDTPHKKDKLAILLTWLELSRAYLGSSSASFLVLPLPLPPQYVVYPAELYSKGYYFECFLLAKNPNATEKILDDILDGWRSDHLVMPGLFGDFL